MYPVTPGVVILLCAYMCLTDSVRASVSPFFHIYHYVSRMHRRISYENHHRYYYLLPAPRDIYDNSRSLGQRSRSSSDGHRNLVNS